MLIYAGIDEAGYGPMLGPLCVALTAFVIEDRDPAAGAPDLWAMLKTAVCRERRDAKKRIAVDDSKNLKTATGGARHPLRHLERGVLAFLGAMKPDHDLPASDEPLFERLGTLIAARPWYDGDAVDLPLASSEGERRIDAGRLGRAMRAAGVGPVLMRCSAIDAAEFNERVERMGTKAAVNFCAVVNLLDAVLRAWPGEHPRVIIDRHGGRIRYREKLQMVFPEHSITILGERQDLSRYRLEGRDGALTVSFQQSAERHHLPVALASMTAKFVRELHMIRMNRYFQRVMPDLKPTAGYVQDARRYVKEIAPVVREAGWPRADLVRSV